MHSQMEITTPAVEALVTRWSGPTFAYPHRGVFEMPNWRFIDTVSPSDFADAAVHWFKAGATAIGGCCGIGPKHIRELSESLPARLRGVC
jgi:S-methylmethionine-dependent homocysteine/selenocysteine methylase